jgi:8-oxo-(d)GTP phosphatase
VTTGAPPDPGGRRRAPERTDVLVVRHGHAGSKERWRGDDRSRPLSAHGRAEAAALVGMLEPLRPARIVSSPLLRCLQTVEPVAERLGLAIETTERLEPDAGAAAAALVLELARQRGPTVVCTHGETIAVIQRELESQGALTFGPDPARDKGSVWVLHARRGRITAADYLAPAAPVQPGRATPTTGATSESSTADPRAPATPKGRTAPSAAANQ